MRFPRKYILKITKKATETTDKFVLDFNKLLQQKFSEVVELFDGNIVKIKQLENIAVLLWNFDKFTGCSTVSTDQFSLVDTCERKLYLPLTVMLVCHILHSKRKWMLIILPIKISKCYYHCICLLSHPVIWCG